MAIYIGNQKIKDVYFASQKINKVYKGSQLVYNAVDLRGFWIHKDTGVKTYFNESDLPASSGYLQQPGWRLNAREVKLATGSILGFTMNTRSPYNATFENCVALQKIEVGASYTGYRAGANAYPGWWSRAFYGCSALTDVNIPEGVTDLSGASFLGCGSLPKIVLPSTMANIYDWVFQYCTSLGEIVCLATTPPTLSAGWVSANVPLASIKVPAPSVNAYKAAPYWSNYSSIITAI